MPSIMMLLILTDIFPTSLCRRTSAILKQSQHFRKLKTAVKVRRPFPTRSSVSAATSVSARLVLSFAPLSIFSTKKPSSGGGAGGLPLRLLSAIPREVYVEDAAFAAAPRRYNGALTLLVAAWYAVRFALRLARVLLTFVPLLCLYPASRLSDRLARLWCRALLLAVQRSGATFVKLGQWASTRRDWFSEEFCDAFATLRDRACVHAWRDTERKLAETFGDRWADIFVYVEKTPVGSGCIAQVHKAYMKASMVADDKVLQACLSDPEYIVDTQFDDAQEIPSSSSSADDQIPVSQGGDSEGCELARRNNLIPVAIKVLHPYVYRSVMRDVAILRGVAFLLERVCPHFTWLSLSECVEEFAQLITKQIDLRYEADCLEQFAHNFENFPNIKFPKPIRPFCKRDILVETFETGEPISTFLTPGADSELVQPGVKSALWLHCLDALLQMVFVDNFVHGDLHPGNILVQNAEHFIQQPENKLVLVDLCDVVVVGVAPPVSSRPLRVVLLDVGISTALSARHHVSFKAFFTAVMIGDGDRVTDILLKSSRHHNCSDLTSLREELVCVVKMSRQNAIKMGKVQMVRLLSEVFAVLHRQRVQLDSDFFSVLLALFLLEGLGRSLHPDVDMLDRARPILMA